MKLKYQLLVVSAFCLSWTSAATAAPSCNGMPPTAARMDFEATKRSLDATANELIARWREDESEFGPVKAAQNHNDRVAMVYSTYQTDRTAAYSAARCEVAHTKKCASTTGRSNNCPIRIGAPPNTRFDQPIVATGKGFREGGRPQATTDLTAVVYEVRKSGKGSNRGGFRTTVSLTPDYVSHAVKFDLKMIQDYFAPKVILQTNQASLTN